MNLLRPSLPLILILLVMSKVTMGQDLKTLELNNKLSILNGRAWFDFPDSAKNIARSVGIMSADKNIARETRIVYDRGEKRLVLFAEELFALGSDDLFELIQKQKVEGMEFEKKVLFETESSVGILSSPTVFDSRRNAILVNSLVVRTPDNTIFRISAFINPEAYDERDDYSRFSERLFKSYQAGDRTNPRNARSEQLKIFGTEKSFEFELPENYLITVDQKYDFQVFRFHKYQAYDDPTWLSLTIYTGHHPSFFHKEYGFEGYTAMQKGEFLGKAVEWYYFENEQNGLYLKEQMIPSDKIEKGLIVHIAMTSNDPSAIEELNEIVKKIKLKK